MKLYGIALLATFLVGAAYGQQDTMHGWGVQSAYNSLYNPQSENTIRGRIVKISHPAPEAGMTAATRITIRKSNGSVAQADLGPEWFLQHQKRQLKLGEQVAVTGSTANVSGVPVLMARKVVQGMHALYLRDLTGSPMWVSVRPHVVVLSLAPNKDNEAGPGQANSATGVVAEATPVPDETTSSTETTATPNAGTAQNMANNTGAPPNSVQGTVQREVQVQNPNTGQVEDYLIVNTDKGPMNVDIGPAWYQQQQPITWSPGGNVVLTGITPSSPVVELPNNGNPIYFANGMTYGNQFMILRNGPWSVWNGWY